MFSTETIAALAVGGVLGFAIPIAAIIVYKKKNRDAWLPSAFIGAATFIVFALVLESLLHFVMLPLVQGNPWTYAVYGAFAAGIFEETGRFVAYKTLMKKRYTTKNAVLMGLGHGGVEAIIVLGYSMILYLILASMANAMGFETLIETLSKGDANTAAIMQEQLGAVADLKLPSVLLSVYERIVAIAFHTSASVFVYFAAAKKGKIWLYPLAILIHAATDFPAALCQQGVLGITVTEIIFTLFAVVMVISAVVLTKKFGKDEA